jgi:hypothetical protein
VDDVKPNHAAVAPVERYAETSPTAADQLQDDIRGPPVSVHASTPVSLE